MIDPLSRRPADYFESWTSLSRVSHLEDLVGRAAHARPPRDGAGLDPLQLPQQRLVAGGRRWRAVCQAAALQIESVLECDIPTTNPNIQLLCIPRNSGGLNYFWVGLHTLRNAIRTALSGTRRIGGRGHRHVA